MSFFKRFIPLFASVIFLLACTVSEAVTQTVAPPTLTPAPVIVTVTATITPTETPTETPEPPPAEPPTATAQPPAGTPIAHLPAGQSIKITFIHMLDGAQGWAIGGLLDGGSSDHVFSTSDGALTWKDITPPEPAPADPQTPKKAIGFFMDAQKAWVAFSGVDIVAPSQAYIWYTTDGGAAWQYSGLTEPALYQEAYVPSDFFFVDALHGWMMAHVGAGMNHDYYALLATVDGGATWKTLISPQGDTSTTQSCSKSGLAFVTPQDGWMAMDCHGVAPFPYFFKTQDGGATWEQITLSVPPAAPNIFSDGYCGLADPTLFTPTSGDYFLDCKQYTDNGTTPRGFLYETTDAGASWKVYPYPGGHLQFVNASTAYALGRNIQRSNDAGHTWTLVRAVNWDGQFSFIDANTAWAVATDSGQIALVKTKDGGATWQEIKPKIAP